MTLHLSVALKISYSLLSAVEVRDRIAQPSLSFRKFILPPRNKFLVKAVKSYAIADILFH